MRTFLAQIHVSSKNGSGPVQGQWEEENDWRGERKGIRCPLERKESGGHSQAHFHSLGCREGGGYPSSESLCPSGPGGCGATEQEGQSLLGCREDRGASLIQPPLSRAIWRPNSALDAKDAVTLLQRAQGFLTLGCPTDMSQGSAVQNLTRAQERWGQCKKRKKESRMKPGFRPQNEHTSGRCLERPLPCPSRGWCVFQRTRVPATLGIRGGLGVGGCGGTSLGFPQLSGPARSCRSPAEPRVRARAPRARGRQAARTAEARSAVPAPRASPAAPSRTHVCKSKACCMCMHIVCVCMRSRMCSRGPKSVHPKSD